MRQGAQAKHLVDFLVSLLEKPPPTFNTTQAETEAAMFEILSDTQEASRHCISFLNQFSNTSKHNGTERSPFHQQLPLAEGSGRGRPLHREAPLNPLMAALLTGLSVKGVDSEGAMS